MSVEATLEFGARITKNAALTNLGGQAPIDQTLRETIRLYAGSDPSIDESWARRMSLTAGTLTIALDALPESNQSALNLTGKVIYAVIIFVLPTATGAMLFAGAGTSPYELWGGATDQVSVDPGGRISHYSPTGFGTVSGTVSDITVTGTAAESFDIALLAGAP